MGFFKDFKEDLSEAVNGLSDAELENATDDGDEDLMVNTLDDPELAKMAEDYKKEAQESESKNNNAVEEVPYKSEQPAKEFNDSSVCTPVQDDDYVADETAVITEGLSINGDLDSLGSIDLFGTVEGNVSCRGKLTVNGSITGNSNAN